MTPSIYQQTIYEWIEHGTGNALVDAVAGAGKTSTLIDGAKRLKTTNACFVAFNKVIAEEIASRLQAIGSPMQASTIHSLGKRCLGKVRIESNKYLKLCRKYVSDVPDLEIVLKDTAEATAVKYLRALVNFAQLTMTVPTESHLLTLVLHYALDDLMRIAARNSALWETIWRGVRVVIEDGKQQYRRERIIDFNDMVCLPTVLGLPLPQFDFIFIDECFPGHTMITLSDGTQQSIQEIVEKRACLSVLCFNEQTSTVEAKKITGWHKVKRNGRNIVRIGNMQSTADHPVYTKEYRYLESSECIKRGVHVLELAHEKIQSNREFNVTGTVDYRRVATWRRIHYQGDLEGSLRECTCHIYSGQGTDRLSGMEVPRATKDEEEEWVYCIDVEDHHNFFANDILVHNCQDLNRAQLELVLGCQSPDGRLLFVGDSRQSLYGFAAADTESIKNIITRTHAVVLPLSICYRCPTLPIQLAQQIYPNIQPSPTAERGTVEIISQADFLRQVQPDTGGCAVIGRCTAPLVSHCLKLLQQGKRAKVRGRDIGAGILDIVERLKKSKHFRFAAFLDLLDDYRDAQLEILGDKPDNEMAIDAFLDKVETIVAFYQAYRDEMIRAETPATIDGFESYITDFFSDEDDRQCILFSTIHKAKGLEFNVVYVLPEKVPHPMAKNDWQYEQELNAEYVLLTRAKKAMYFVGRLIGNLKLPTEEPTVPTPEPESIAAFPLSVVSTEPSVLVEAKAIVASQEAKRGGGRPKKQKERLQVKVSSDVAAYLRSLKGGDEGYSGYLEDLVRSDPGFTTFSEQQSQLGVQH